MIKNLLVTIQRYKPTSAGPSVFCQLSPLISSMVCISAWAATSCHLLAPAVYLYG